MKPLFFLFVTITFYIFPDSLLRLDMPIYPPYAYVTNNTYSGVSYQTVIKVLEKSQIDYIINPVPNFGRAFEDTKNGLSDGFFVASQNESRDEIASFSEPIGQSVWTWVARSNFDLEDNERLKFSANIGVQLNSNLHRWLLINKYNVTSTPSNIKLLFKLLDSNRVDVIFLPRAVALRIIYVSSLNSEDYIMKTEKTENLGIYISKEYIDANPETWDKLNKAIKDLNLDFD